MQSWIFSYLWIFLIRLGMKCLHYVGCGVKLYSFTMWLSLNSFRMIQQRSNVVWGRSKRVVDIKIEKSDWALEGIWRTWNGLTVVVHAAVAVNGAVAASCCRTTLDLLSAESTTSWTALGIALAVATRKSIGRSRADAAVDCNVGSREDVAVQRVGDLSEMTADERDLSLWVRGPRSCCTAAHADKQASTIITKTAIDYGFCQFASSVSSFLLLCFFVFLTLLILTQHCEWIVHAWCKCVFLVDLVVRRKYTDWLFETDRRQCVCDIIIWNKWWGFC